MSEDMPKVNYELLLDEYERKIEELNEQIDKLSRQNERLQMIERKRIKWRYQKAVVIAHSV